MKVSVRDLLKNKYVLYLVALIAVIEVLGHLTVQDFEAVTIFVIAALLANYFSKNMIIVLGAGVVATTIFTATRVVKEGMKEGNDKEASSSQPETGNNDTQDANNDSSSEEAPPSCDAHTSKDSCPSETCLWNESSNSCGAKQDGFTTNNVPSASPAKVSGEEETEEEVEEVEAKEEKEEMGYATKEELAEVKTMVEEIKAMLEPKEEMSEEVKEEIVEEVKEELSAVKPIKHNPEASTPQKKQVQFAKGQFNTTLDRVLSKLNK